MARPLVSDELWQLIEPLIPKLPRRRPRRLTDVAVWTTELKLRGLRGGPVVLQAYPKSLQHRLPTRVD
jgi:hypothetical protein